MIFCKSVSQKDFSLKEREKYYSTVSQNGILPGVFLQTCNRTELYFGQGDIPNEVARHLFRVVSGLESSLIGEGAVLSQVKEAYQEACQKFKLPGEMHKLFEYALQTGKKVRTDTKISRGAVSHSLAAIEIIEKEGIELKNTTITIIGVNKLTSDILKFLKNKGAKTVFLANRSFDKAKLLAEPFGFEVFPLTEKHKFLNQTDVLISATKAPHLIIKKSDIKADKKLLAIDLAFPRDIDPEISEFKNIRLYNLEDVEKTVKENIEVRETEVIKAEEIIEEEITKLQQALLRRNEHKSYSTRK